MIIFELTFKLIGLLLLNQAKPKTNNTLISFRFFFFFFVKTSKKGDLYENLEGH